MAGRCVRRRAARCARSVPENFAISTRGDRLILVDVASWHFAILRAKSAFELGRVKTFMSVEFGAFEDALVFSRRELCPHCCHQRPDTHDADHPGHVVGQKLQRHL